MIRLLSFAVLPLCLIARNQPVEPEYSDVFIVKSPYKRPLTPRADEVFKDKSQVEITRRVRLREMFHFHIFEKDNLAIVASRAIKGASRPDSIYEDAGVRLKPQVLILHIQFGESLVPDFSHAIIVACVVSPGGPKSMNTE